MSIVKATVRHLLRRKWKLILVVALFGSALVALTHAYDVAGMIEAAEAAEAALFESPEPPTDEQMEALTRGILVRAVFGVLSFFFSLGVVLIGMLMVGGVVANERRDGAIMLWAQHPMPLSRFYLTRYLGIQGANLGAQALFGITAVLAVLPASGFPATETGIFLEICVEGALACAISFAVTALGIRRAAFLALAYYAASGIASTVLTLAADIPELPETGILAVILQVIPFLIFPTLPVNDLMAGFESGVAWNWKATGMVLYHFALWTAVAWLGLRRIEGKPLKL